MHLETKTKVWKKVRVCPGRGHGVLGGSFAALP